MDRWINRWVDGWMDSGVRGDVFGPIVLITSPALTASVLRPSSAQVNTRRLPGLDLSWNSLSV